MERLVRGAERLGLSLSPQQAEQFEAYYRLLMEWNRRINLTAIVDYDQVQTRHFLDSLTVILALPPLGPDFRLLDVGTGAGLPGLPLKILFPQVRLVLLDSVAKKTAFLSHVVAELGLKDVEVITSRAEELGHRPGYRENFSAVLSRAVAPLTTLVELALPFCKQGGLFIAQKGREIEAEINRASKAIDILGGRLREVREIALEELGGERLLVVIEKVAPTPSRYPRRPGVPSHRPLA